MIVVIAWIMAFIVVLVLNRAMMGYMAMLFLFFGASTMAWVTIIFTLLTHREASNKNQKES